MTSYVIVPLDGSELAEQALPLAVSLVRESMASFAPDASLSVLQLVQVVPSPIKFESLVSPPDRSRLEVIESSRDGAHSYLSDIEAELTAIGMRVKIAVIELSEAELGYAEVALSITNIANTQEEALMVMSTHGRGGLARLRLGSVTDQVRKLAQCPLIIMRPQEPIQKMPVLEQNLPLLRRIVVPLDGSLLAEQVLSHAKKLARTHSAQLLLFRSVSAVSQGMIGADVAVLDTKQYEMNRHHARDYLKGIQSSLEAEGFNVRIEVGGMPTADAILRYAAKVDADLIAMATHARGAIGRLIWGSVTDQVVRAGQIPVLVTKADTKE